METTLGGAFGSRRGKDVSRKCRPRLQFTESGVRQAPLSGGGEGTHLRQDVVRGVAPAFIRKRWQRLVAVEGIQKCGSAARHTTLHRSDGGVADLGCLLVGKTSRADKDDRLALRVGQPSHRPGGV